MNQLKKSKESGNWSAKLYIWKYGYYFGISLKQFMNLLDLNSFSIQ